jgi:SAM-dependent methyltransferase
MAWLTAAFLALGVLLLYSLLRGAPYVPTKRRDIESALEMMQLKPGDTVVDLGSGDGSVLKIAADKGHRAVGYEINPLLVLISRWRLRGHRDARVVFGDFRLLQLPDDTRAIYMFSAGAFITSMGEYLKREVGRMGHPVTVVSYGFKLSGEKPVATSGALAKYRIHP